ncbi:MAG: threonylcarbamoyl-AMP synthase [Bacteroidetes bacterium]|nr:threonylcarbamoyl-AMP synthase [Bacteroidota bacterium]
MFIVQNKLLTLTMFIRLNPDKIDYNNLAEAVKVLRNGGVVVYPTDSVYAFGCDMMNQKAIEKLCRIKGIKPEKSTFSFICADLSSLSDYTVPISNTVFRAMKKALPGPFTFILEANSNVPKLLKQSRKTVGIRVPANAICKELVESLGNPILSTSLHNNEDELINYFSEPTLIYEKYKEVVDLVIDGGYGSIYPTTVVDCSGKEIEIVREGAGDIALLDL